MNNAIEAVNALAAMSLVLNGRCASCSRFIDGKGPWRLPGSAQCRIGLIRFTLDLSYQELRAVSQPLALPAALIDRAAPGRPALSWLSGCFLGICLDRAGRGNENRGPSIEGPSSKGYRRGKVAQL